MDRPAIEYESGMDIVLDEDVGSFLTWPIHSPIGFTRRSGIDPSVIASSSAFMVDSRGLIMIDHVSIPIRDLSESTAFYESVLSKIGFAKLVEKPGTVGFGKKYPEFWLNQRSRGHGIGDGFHVCLRARTADQVRDFHAHALALGARSDGEPGFRPEYSDSYYAAFILDKDGNRIEVVTFVTDKEQHSA